MSDPVTTPQPQQTAGTFVATAPVSFAASLPAAVAAPEIREPRGSSELFLTFRQWRI